MLKYIIEKELRDMISSTKFVVTFAICAVLILLAFYTGAQNYRVSQSQYQAAKTENLRQLEGLTDWIMVRNFRIFLPPEPLAALVTGISNDIGRSVTVQGRGELATQDSRFSDEPVFAVFRFLDLDFIFQIVLSLFAILFAYDAINGEKERGTLRLTFANAVPRAQYILGKIIGSFLALAVPVLLAILLGCLLLPLLGVHLNGDEWLRLGLMIFAGLLYFGVFLMLAVFISSLTHRTSSSFLLLLVIWIFSVLIIPRTAVLLAGRAVDVPSVDEIASQKNRLRSQLWSEDRKKMSEFKPTQNGDPQTMVSEFNKFMSEAADEREKKMNELASRLNEDRHNKQAVQEKLAFGLARLSPAAAFSMATTNLAGTSMDMKAHFLSEAQAYQKTYAEFMQSKTGMNIGGGAMVFRMRSGDGEEDVEKPIDAKELPEFNYAGLPLDRVVGAALPDLGILALFNLLFFAGAFVAFLRYDLR
ncbi:MAG: ABC transporter permease subunit [Deferribacteres bacterium]|nr:ABC transporter permease subunit [Deferribacteres bacterium]